MKQIGNLLLLCLLSSTCVVQAQDKYAYFLQLDTKTSTLSDIENLSDKALDRRKKFGIPLNTTDLPVDRIKIDQLSQDTSIQILYTLKWLNAVVIETTKTDMSSIESLPFVVEAQYVGVTKDHNSAAKSSFSTPVLKLKNNAITPSKLTQKDYGVAYEQNEQIGAIQLHKMGYDGSNIDIAVFDAGFKNINKIPGFLKAQGNGLLSFGYDIVDLDNVLVDSDNHGTSVSSCIGAYDVGNYVGSAPNAHLILFRTEYAKTETPLEELNWCKAAELADSAGVDMITSSLGYNQYDDPDLSYEHSDLNGRTSFISRSATVATRKGIVVLNSAGNEGSRSWRKIGTPADAPSVITIGAIDKNGHIGSFSSHGYNADGIVKPDVCALGVNASVASTTGGYYSGHGTSYATPIAAGGVACLLQAFPHLPPDSMAQLIRYTGGQYINPDSQNGYGKAQLDLAYHLQKARESEIKITHILAQKDNSIYLYRGSGTTLSYTITEHKKILWLFKRKKTIAQKALALSGEMSTVDLTPLNLECSKRYSFKATIQGTIGTTYLRLNRLNTCSSK